MVETKYENLCPKWAINVIDNISTDIVKNPWYEITVYEIRPIHPLPGLPIASAASDDYGWGSDLQKWIREVVTPTGGETVWSKVHEGYEIVREKTDPNEEPICINCCEPCNVCEDYSLNEDGCWDDWSECCKSNYVLNKNGPLTREERVKLCRQYMLDKYE